MKPIIGILAEIDNEQTTLLRNAFARAVEESGGVPILLPYVRDVDTIAQFVELCDGFLFTGGADINPLRYGEEKQAECGETHHFRDELEFAVWEQVWGTSKPILAICRGLQLVNVALGGTLYQDIYSALCTELSHRQTEPRFSPSHSVQVIENTPLFHLTGQTSIPANTFHHQAIKTLGKGLEVMALADDGMIEAVYLPGTRYLRAYQWHPERLYDNDVYNRGVFDDFIGACQHRREE